MLPLLLLQVVEEDFAQVRLPGLLQRLEQEVLIIDHELLQLLLVEPLVLELALVDLAHARAVQVLAGKEAEVVRVAAAGASVAVVCQGKLAQLVFL